MKRLIATILSLFMSIGSGMSVDSKLGVAPNAADTEKPYIVSSTPVDYETNVSVNVNPKITFNEDMSVSSSDGLKNDYAVAMYENDTNTLVATSKSYDSATKTLTIVPTVPLKEDKAYRIMVNSYYCRDLAGNTMEVSGEILFSTTGVSDTLPPKIEKSNLVNGQIKVPTDLTATLSFNEEMNATTINSNTVKLQEVVNSWTFTDVPSTVTFDEGTKTVSIKPNTKLKEYVEYRVYLKSDIKDLAGNKLKEFVAKFKTATSDVAGPKIVSTNIANGAKDVLPETKFEVTFDEKIKESYDAGKKLSDNVIVKKNGEVVDITKLGVSLIYSTGYKVLSIPGQYSNFKWDKSSTYEITIKGGLVDSYDNPIGQDYTYTFTTVTADTTPPVIKSVTPADGDTGVSLTPVVTAIFNEPLIKSNIENSYSPIGIYYSTDGGQYWQKIKDSSYNNAYTIQYDETDKENTKITITPTLELKPSTMYKINLNVPDLQWNYPVKYEYYFTTKAADEGGGGGNDTTPPTITSSYPQLKEYLDMVKDVPVDMKATVTFSEEMKESTINSSNIQILFTNSSYVSEAVPATVSYNAETKTATIVPTAPLQYLKEYRVNVKNVQDTAGNTISTTPEWNAYFKTGPKVKPLNITSVEPKEDATDVVITKRIKVTFDEELSFSTQDILNNLTVKENGIELPENNGGITISIEKNLIYISKDYKYDGSNIWKKNAVYEITLGKNIKDIYGNTMLNDKVWTFKTVEEDATPPVLKSLAPELSTNIDNPSTLIGLKPSFSAVFSEPLDASSYGEYGYVGLYYFIGSTPYKVQTGGKNAWTITYDESDKANVKLSLSSSIDLEENRLYMLKMEPRDKNYNSTVENKFYFIPKTESITINPKVLFTNPFNKATGVELNVIPEITFDTIMNSETINENSVVLYEGLAKLDATISNNLTKVTIEPKAALKPLTIYRAVISDSVTDINGNKLSQPYEFTFTTKDQVPEVKPEIETIKAVKEDGTKVDIVDGAIDIPENLKIEITFNKAMNEETIKKGYSEYIYVTMNEDKTQDYTLTESTISTVDGKTKVEISWLFGFPLTLEKGTKYYLVIPATVSDLNGNFMSRKEIGFTTAGEVVLPNKINKVDVDKVSINDGAVVVSPVEINKNPRFLTVTTEKSLAGVDINDSSVRVWEENGTAYGNLVTGTTAKIVDNCYIVDLSRAAIKVNTVYRVKVSQYLESVDGAPLDKDYSYYFKPVENYIDFTEGTVIIKGNNVIRKDEESKLTVTTDIGKMKTMNFTLQYDTAQISVSNVSAAESIKDKGVDINVLMDEQGNELGQITFKAALSEEVNVTDLFDITVKSLQGNKSYINFGEVTYTKSDNILSYAKGISLIITGITLDFDNDGKVTILDIIAVTRNFGIDESSSEWDKFKGRDIDGNKVIDEKDADILRDHLGEIIK